MAVQLFAALWRSIFVVEPLCQDLLANTGRLLLARQTLYQVAPIGDQLGMKAAGHRRPQDKHDVGHTGKVWARSQQGQLVQRDSLAYPSAALDTERFLKMRALLAFAMAYAFFAFNLLNATRY